MNPKHHNPTRKRRDRRGNEFWAHAPYNFVPLPEKVVTVDPDKIPGHDVYTGYTGYIDCTLETRSPLYTRCALDPDFFARWADNIREMMKDDAAREQYAQFFHLDDAEQPVIPGSSLRGMVRALVEIAGYGKMQWVTNEPLVFRAVGDRTSLGDYYRRRLMKEDRARYFTPLVQAGYMLKQGSYWFIQPAKTIGGTTFARIHYDLIPNKESLAKWRGCKNAYLLWVRLGDYNYQPVRGGFLHLKYTPVLEARPEATPGFQEGVLACSGKMKKKQREIVVFPPDESAALIPVSDDLVRAYRNQITKEQRQLLGDEGVLNPGQPVFYLMENDQLVFFGHTMLFRLPYQRSPLDLVPEKLRRIDSVDLAEAMFGFVPQEKNDRRQARAGRVFFTNACLEPNQTGVWLSQVTPEILSGPKPTTFQHYLTQQEPDEVDSGKRDRKGNPKMELRLDHYASPPPHETTIRGHKIYWHQGPIKLDDVRERDRVDWSTDTQHTAIRPVKAGVTFRFRIYFENLRDFELGALLWALTLPGDPGKDYCHSLGMGKPLGMGAVKITPTLYLSNRAERYTQLFAGSDWRLGEEKPSDTQAFVRSFEDFVLSKMDAQERKQAQSLKEVERIKMLL
ncbi:TIGR03986 family CRISPR-associated RAMP protein, partial [Candidatus Parcubacteria bacterium]